MWRYAASGAVPCRAGRSAPEALIICQLTGSDRCSLFGPAAAAARCRDGRPEGAPETARRRRRRRRHRRDDRSIIAGRAEHSGRGGQEVTRQTWSVEQSETPDGAPTDAVANTTVVRGQTLEPDYRLQVAGQ